MVYPHTFRTEHSETKTTNSSYGEYYTRSQKKKIFKTPQLIKILQYVDSHRKDIVNDLEELVTIKSISGQLAHREDCKDAVKLAERWLRKLGVKYECFDVGYQEIDGKKVRLPVIILGTLGKDPAKKTVCFYSYLDVNKPKEDEWRVDPWKVTEIDRRLYGCGVAGGKAVTISWFMAIQAFQKSKQELPVNIKLIIEGMHNRESRGLEEFLALRKQDFFYNVDYFIVCDSEWIGDKNPCLVYGSVGTLHFEVSVEKTEKSTTEPKEDIVKLFEKIADDKEQILIPHFNDTVRQVTPDEERLYEAIQDFDVTEVRESLPEFKQKWDKSKILMHFWRLSSVLVGDVEECTCEKNDSSQVKRKFVVKIVPKQVVENCTDSVMRHVQTVTKELKIKNKVSCELLSASRHWFEDIRSANYEAARKATIQIYKEEPSMIREDRPLRVVTMLSRTLDKSVLVLPIGDRHINTGGSNENMPKKNYYEGIKLLGAYLIQIANT